MSLPAALDLALAAALSWLALGVASLAVQRRMYLVSRVLYPLGAATALALALAGLMALGQPVQERILPLGLPDLPFHLRLDSLSGFFLVLLGGAGFAISVFSVGYFRRSEGTAPGLVSLQYHVFLASMALVLLADDAYLFMVAWETMALSSYFLVTTNHRIPEIRRAGFLYLLIAHVGAIAILLCFGVLAGFSGEYTFAAMRDRQVAADWASVTFLLALFGFGAKAGLLPLHAWLPEAHPAAPSPVSAMMSGVMLKTAIYGLVRVTFDLLDTQLWWWGTVALALGLASALFGVIFAAVQSDMKRLLAYSSIENIGIIVAGIGLAIVFRASDMGFLAALAFTAALYHCLNHAFFKSLLFLATGHVLHATGERNLGRLGGLIHRMPWLASCALVGTLAIASLPPLNGFVSEWLLLQAFLFSPDLPNPYLHMLVPAAAGVLVLAAALAGYVMVKFYGVIFLGQPREEKLARAHDAGGWERAALLWLAGGCVALGLFPVQVITFLDPVTAAMTGRGLAESAARVGWLFLTPAATPERASYSPLLAFAVIVVGIGFTYLMVRLFYHGRIRRGHAWDCGYPLQTPRMQDTAEGFGQPIRVIFEPFIIVHREFPSPFDTAPRYSGSSGDKVWRWVYLPIALAAERVASWVSVLQRGRIHVYLLYSFGTLLFLLLFLR
jgi:formate hydrogenlyase subunit 3/multisubunit Na+/H+ antiporter MnhD subunit